MLVIKVNLTILLKENLMIFRKVGILFVCACLVSSCGGESVWNNAYETFATLAKGSSDFELTREQVEKIPYATISAKVGDGRESLLVLAYVKPTELQWVASNMASLIISKSGELLQTIGLEKDLYKKSIVSKNGQFFIDVGLDAEEVYFVDYFYRGDKPHVLRAQCVMLSLGIKEIEVLKYKYSTKYYKENCETKNGWSFSNEYWVDQKTGKLYQSRQYYLEKKPPILIKLLKPFSG